MVSSERHPFAALILERLLHRSAQTGFGCHCVVFPDAPSRPIFFDSCGLPLRAWIGLAAVPMNEWFAGAQRVINLAFHRPRALWASGSPTCWGPRPPGGRGGSVVKDSWADAVPNMVGELAQSIRDADLGIAPSGRLPHSKARARHRAAS